MTGVCVFGRTSGFPDEHLAVVDIMIKVRYVVNKRCSLLTSFQQLLEVTGLVYLTAECACS